MPGQHNCSNYFEPIQDGYPVAGNSVDVVVDGVSRRVKLVPAAEPGMRKAVVLVPADGRVHRVTYAIVYDLGLEGLVPVTESIVIDARGDRHYLVITPVDRAEFEEGAGRRPIKLKN